MKIHSFEPGAPGSIDVEAHRRAKWRNRINTWLILVGLTALLALSAGVLFGQAGVVWAVGVTLGFLLLAPRMSPKIVLRLYKAREMPPRSIPQLHDVICSLAKRALLPSVPKLYHLPSSNMNAFAVGRPDDSAITLTDGLLRGLTLRQLTGVLAHEVSHIASDDVKVMGLADVVGRLTSLMQTIGFALLVVGLWQSNRTIFAAIVLIFAPLIGVALQLALSRSREYQADLNACQLTGDPVGLASALQSLERKQGALWESLLLPGGRIPDPSILRTHPKTEDRVKRLLALKSQYEPDLIKPGQSMDPPFGPGSTTKKPKYRISGLWY